MTLPPSGFSSPTPPAGGPSTPGVPFEGPGGFFQRFGDQLMLLTTDPVGAGRALGGEPAPLGPAFSFSLFASFVAYGPVLVLASCLMLIIPTMFAVALPPEFAAVQGGMFCVLIGALPFLILFGHLISDLLFGASFHLCAILAGGKGTFSQSLRAVLYTRGTTTWFLPVWLLILVTSCIPLLPALVQIVARIVLLVLAGFTLFGAAQAVHGLPEDRAVLAAVLSLVVGVVAAMALAGLAGFALFLLTAGGLAGLGALASP
jgi:hypothetical protein